MKITKNKRCNLSPKLKGGDIMIEKTAIHRFIIGEITETELRETLQKKSKRKLKDDKDTII